MLPTETDYLRLSYRADLHLLIMRWTRAATSVEHRAGYQAALGLAQEHQAGHWLIDLRSRGLAELADLQWVLEDFRAEMRSTLPATTRRLAYLTTPFHADILRPRLTELARGGEANAQVQVFTEEMPAQQWLQSGQ
ncbi:hypothetical protein [Hymenobacter glacieicola]|uniref:STAS/SEC14 domain-containing protein n=1 Tax=Hymenobacter glacieicola TaxID=1562124 RepID=A0ABQ1WNL9_9BACT|nr:hypothetical protein [Hymenobacter glacieicola]GGG39958.1 hypothetical protein GCM10011378_15310 [Hymenobacter glacieicola]